jgi:hypothetical protein
MRHVLIILFIVLIGCASIPGQISQGIEGQILWVTGNRMPGPDRQLPPPEPVQRWVYVTPVIKMNQLPDMEEGLYPSLPVEPVDSVQTNKKGNFRLNLPTGTYSLFTREEGGYFANTFNQEGQVNPVTIKDGQVSEITIEINYSAVY